MIRHGLLLTAVATVTVPGLLAVLGVVAHEHHATSAETASPAFDSSPVSAPFTLAPASAQVPVINNLVSERASGMRLLDKAADAGVATSYQGTELITQSGVDGTVRVTSQVWHQAGGMTLVQTSDSGTPAAASTQADAASGSPEGVFGVTSSLVALIGRHYVARYQGTGTVVGRPATVVELYHFDGSPAARYWLDKQTALPLRRQLFDTANSVISDDSFVHLRIGTVAGSGGAAAAAAAPQRQAQAPSAWVTAAPSAGFLATLTSQGWQLPRTKPGGLPLYAAAWTSTVSGKVVDLEYSDGLYVISLFVQRGDLAAQLPGWQQVTVGSQRAFVSGHSVTWAGLGFVYTLIADAPPQLVATVVGALPSSGPPGLVDRIGRGLGRLASLLNPFG